METQYLLFIIITLLFFLVISQAIVHSVFAKAIEIIKRAGTGEDKLLDQSKDKSHTIIHRAIEEANRMLVSAELKGIAAMSKEKLSGEQMSAQYKDHLAALEKELALQFDRSVRQAESSYANVVGSIEQTIAKQVEQNKKIMEEKANMMLSTSQSLLDTYIADIQAKVKAQIDGEFATVRAEVQDYKEHRMRVIDERIIDVLQDILNVTLWKKINLADQQELVYKALEEAKQENAFK